MVSVLAPERETRTHLRIVKTEDKLSGKTEEFKLSVFPAPLTLAEFKTDNNEEEQRLMELLKPPTLIRNPLLDEIDPDKDPTAFYKLYISTIPRLTDEEEQLLGKTINTGREAWIFLQTFPEDERLLQTELQKKTNQADAAKRKLTESNLGLVLYVAFQYQGLGLPVLDLIQEGSIGLQMAAEGYDYTKSKFSTHAVYWIRKEVIRALEDTVSIMRHPAHISQKGQKFRRIEGDLPSLLGRNPTREEFIRACAEIPSDRLGVDEKELTPEESTRCKEVANELNLIEIAWQRNPFPLDGDDDDSLGRALLESIPDPTIKTVEEEFGENYLNEVLPGIIDKLLGQHIKDPGRRKAFRLYYGEEGWTYEGIASFLGEGITAKTVERRLKKDRFYLQAQCANMTELRELLN